MTIKVFDAFGNESDGDITKAAGYSIQQNPFDLQVEANLSSYLTQQVKNQQNAQLIDLLRNLHDGLVVFAAYAQHNELTGEEEIMYRNLVDMARSTVKALGYERVVETADLMAMEVPEGNKA